MLFEVSVTIVDVVVAFGEPNPVLLRGCSPFVSGDIVLVLSGTGGFWSNVVLSTKSVLDGAMSNVIVCGVYAAYTVPVYLSVV